VISKEIIPKHTFVCEYKTHQVLTRDEAVAEERHKTNQMGCYMY